MTRRDVFARLAGLLGVPYVAKALPPTLKPGDVFTMASVNVVNYPTCGPPLRPSRLTSTRERYGSTTPRAARGT